jgi:nitroreductase/formate hydrogenlyase subunit 6/NADH:ubiquinone oxidoreductase subunit I
VKVFGLEDPVNNQRYPNTGKLTGQTLFQIKNRPNPCQFFVDFYLAKNNYLKSVLRLAIRFRGFRSFKGVLMIDRQVTTIIDQEKCIGCELCVKVCPSETISMQEGKANVTGDRSLQCGHCVAVCPVDAVRVDAIDKKSLSFNSFDLENDWLPHGESDTARLVQLMASRRSCRNYTGQTVDRSVLEDLVKIGTTAPSGTNSQHWTFTIFPDRGAVIEFAQRIGAFFRNLNRMAEKRLMRKALKMIGKPALDNYYREYYPSAKEALQEWEQHGRDRLFHGATAVIVVASKPGGSCPMEDAMLATQNILLAGHSLGLGSCLIGYAVEAIRNDPTIKQFIKITAEETVYAVIALGHPDETYERLTGRKRFELRYYEALK